MEITLATCLVAGIIHIQKTRIWNKGGLFSQQTYAWEGPSLVIRIIRQSWTQKVQILSEICNKFTSGNFGQITLFASFHILIS